MAALSHQLEYQFLKIIFHGVKNKTISIPEAKQLAIEFLTIEPFVSEDDASGKIASFCAEHEKFLAVKEYMDSYDKERVTIGKVNAMRKLVKENNIDEALNIIKE